MRVLIINTSERIGGAAIAAGRLMESLKNNGIKAKMLVRDKQTDQISVVGLKRSWLQVWKFMWERIVIWSANRFQRYHLFDVDIANTGTDITSLPEFRQADVIHLHWINQGMLSLKDIRKILTSGKPVVWTMHDMWPCTGICHYARECTNYQQECHNCPYIYKGGSKKDLSYRTFRKKQKLYSNAPVHFVTCSRWLKEQAQVSRLFEGKSVINIPNAINTNLFKPQNKEEARAKCMLPQNKKLILFGSVKITDKRKGAEYLIEACKLLAEKHPEWVIHYPNREPYYYRNQLALDLCNPEVQDYVMNNERAELFVKKLEDLVQFLLPNYIWEGKNQLVIAIGCTGGKHRSVTLANRLYEFVSGNEHYGARIEHRDIEKDAVVKAK